MGGLYWQWSCNWKKFTVDVYHGYKSLGENPNFEWEGHYNGDLIRVILPRNESEESAQITGVLPTGYDKDWGSTSAQLYAEIRRIIRILN